MYWQDEPTAHLDLKAIESLAACLKTYSGAVLLVSHDQHFVSSLASQVGRVMRLSLLVPSTCQLLPELCIAPS